MSLAIYKNYLSRLTPTNLNQEKERFFNDQRYNPQFEYRVPINFDSPPYKGDISLTYLPLAISILDKASNAFGSEEAYFDNSEGDWLPFETIQYRVNEYLKINNLMNQVSLSFSADYASRTAIEKNETKFELRMRVPAVYREFSLNGMLHHEIGTHVFRWLNDQQLRLSLPQELKLTGHRETEEGLASFHTLLESKVPYLWNPALYYFTVATAKEYSFASLFLTLEKYCSSPQRRWELCLRAKRGLKDTSQLGGFFKDQTYLSGAVSVAQWISLNGDSVEQLYKGKISLKDLSILEKYQTNSLQLPAFLNDKKSYLSRMNEIFSFNQLANVW